MQNNLANLSATIDPATVPIQDYEVKFLVRFLHKISCRLNDMVCMKDKQSCFIRLELILKYTSLLAVWRRYSSTILSLRLCGQISTTAIVSAHDTAVV